MNVVGEDPKFDIHEMNITQNGVLDFDWPVRYSEREIFCDKLIEGYTDLVQQFSDTDLLAYKFLAKYFATEALATFNSDLLISRYGKNFPKLEPGIRWRLWSNLPNGVLPNPPPFMEKLQCGPSKKNKITYSTILNKLKRVGKSLQFQNRGLAIGNLKIRAITNKVLRDDIIATQRTDLIQKHASIIEKEVVFCRSERWFREVDNSAIETSMRDRNCAFEEAIMLLVKELYKNNAVSITPISEMHLQGILTKGAAIIRVHNNRLLDKSDLIPKTIWTGSGGNIWDAMLRYACRRKNDGYAVGHDHGAALGHVNNHMMGFSELWGIDEFFCLNKNQTNEFKQLASSWNYFETDIPKFTATSIPDNFQMYRRYVAPSFKVKTIIILATLYGGDRVWLGPCSPDMVHADWQAQLISKLKSWGYRVILKVHPESAVMPPKIFSVLGAEIRIEPLEEMMTEGDLVLFDCVYTSVFRSILSTNIPMVLIDFYSHPWTEKGLTLLEKRVGFLSAGFDQDNRKTINWDNLKIGIEESTTKSINREFFDYYYG